MANERSSNSYAQENMKEVEGALTCARTYQSIWGASFAALQGCVEDYLTIVLVYSISIAVSVQLNYGILHCTENFL